MKLSMKIKRDFMKVYMKSEVLKELNQNKKFIFLRKVNNNLAKTSEIKFKNRIWLNFTLESIKDDDFFRKKLINNIFNERISRIYFSENKYLEITVNQKED